MVYVSLKKNSNGNFKNRFNYIVGVINFGTVGIIYIIGMIGIIGIVDIFGIYDALDSLIVFMYLFILNICYLFICLV